MTFYRWLEPFIEQNGPFAPAASYAHSDFDFPMTSNVHELSDYIFATLSNNPFIQRSMLIKLNNGT
ncbi:YozE family protein [Lactiplantibacillus pentosus]